MYGRLLRCWFNGDFVLLKLFNSPLRTIGHHLPFDWYIWDSHHSDISSSSPHFFREISRNIWAAFMAPFHGHLNLHSSIVQFKSRCRSLRKIFHFKQWNHLTKTTTLVQEVEKRAIYNFSNWGLFPQVLVFKYFMVLWTFWQLSTQKW